MHEEIATIGGTISFGVDPQGKGAGVTLRFDVIRENGHKHRLHLTYEKYYQMILVAGVTDVQSLGGMQCIVEIDGERNTARFARMVV